MRAPVARAARPRRAGRRGAGARTPIAWQDPDVRWKPRTIDAARSRRPPARGCARTPMAVYGDFDALEVTRDWATRGRRTPSASDAEIRGALTKAAAPPADHRRRGARAVPGRGRGARGALRGGRRPARRGRRRRGHLRDQPEHQLHERLLRGVPVLRVRPAGGGPRVVHAHARPRWPTARRRRGRAGATRGVHAGRASIPTCPAPSTSTSSTP